MPTDELETPVDLAAAQADDALLDMLSGAGVITDDALARALVAWRREVDGVPVGELVDVDTAVAVVERARRARRARAAWVVVSGETLAALVWWAWLLMTVGAAGVVLALLVGGGAR